MQQKLSVIVPIYNSQDYLVECIESLITQTQRDIEIILVDDGSTDQSSEICDHYASRDDRIVVLHKSNAGKEAARNDGLKVANGEWISFCDSDDKLSCEAFSIMLQAADSSGAEIIVADMYLWKSDSVEISQLFDKPFFTDDRKILDQLICTTIYSGCNPYPPKKQKYIGYGSMCNKIVKRSLIEAAGIQFDPSMCGIYEDRLFSVELLQATRKLQYICKPVYYYRQIPVSDTKAYKINRTNINKTIFSRFAVVISMKNSSFYEAYNSMIIACFYDLIMNGILSMQNPMRLLDKIRAIRRVIGETPYEHAISQASYSCLQKSHATVAKFAKKGKISHIVATCFAVQLRNRIRTMHQ